MASCQPSAGAERSDSGRLLHLKSLIKKPGSYSSQSRATSFHRDPFRLLWPRRPWEEPLMVVRLKENSGRPIMSAVSPCQLHPSPPRPESHCTQLGGLLKLTITGRRRELTFGCPVSLLQIEIVRAKAYDTHERQT